MTAPTKPPTSSFGGAAPVTAFVNRLVDTACDKLVTCGVMPGQTRSLCKSMFDDFRDPDADDKVAQGICRFDARAANSCLRQIADIDCARVSTDMTKIATLLAGPLVSCQRSFECR